VANLVQIRPRANGWNITNYLFIYLFIHFFISWRQLHVRPVDGFSRLMAQTTRTRTRVCLLGVSLILLPHFGAEILSKPQFWGVNRRFQAKRAKYWKFHAIETTASILTKFGTTIDTTKWSSWVVPVGAKQIQDGGRPFDPILMKFGKVTHTAPLTAVRPLKFRIFENPRWRRPPSRKSQKSRYLHNGLTDLYEIWYANAKWAMWWWAISPF